MGCYADLDPSIHLYRSDYADEMFDNTPIRVVMNTNIGIVYPFQGVMRLSSNNLHDQPRLNARSIEYREAS